MPGLVFRFRPSGERLIKSIMKQTHLLATLQDLSECEAGIETLTSAMSRDIGILETESHVESRKLSDSVAQDTEEFTALLQNRAKVTIFISNPFI